MSALLRTFETTASITRESHRTGSIAVTVVRPNRVAWLVLWPSVRPWHFTNPQPMLRCLCDADAVTPLLARTLEADASRQMKALAPIAATTALPVGVAATATLAA